MSESKINVIKAQNRRTEAVRNDVIHIADHLYNEKLVLKQLLSKCRAEDEISVITAALMSIERLEVNFYVNCPQYAIARDNLLKRKAELNAKKTQQ